MPSREVRERRARFFAALSITQTTRKAFATELGVTREHLHHVLGGRRESPRIVQAVDDYIAKHAPKGPSPVKATERKAVA